VTAAQGSRAVLRGPFIDVLTPVVRANRLLTENG
jgi:hypothetical protein